jgi:uncharacterized LabA/DUF88 family protein
MSADEERIALFLDYENLAIGAREDLGGVRFDLKPLADALAERGRVIVRRAYADWSYFDEDRRMLTQQHVELIEIPQRMGTVRKNAADIKMAVDAIELSFERDYITTFVICTGDSDFTPLVGKLRELNRRVIGVGLQASTSKLLPPACDEFLFYERLEGVEIGDRRRQTRAERKASRNAEVAAAVAVRRAADPAPDERDADPAPVPGPPPGGEPEAGFATGDGFAPDAGFEPDLAPEPPPEPGSSDSVADLGKLVAQTLSGLQRTTGGAVLASSLKRAILRKDPTFSEADYGFRAFGELLRHLADRHVIELSASGAKGDPEVGFPEKSSNDEDDAFALLQDTVRELQERSGPPPLSGLKNQLRKRSPAFSEKEFGFGGFLQFTKAAQTRGLIAMHWDDEADDYVLEAR